MGKLNAASLVPSGAVPPDVEAGAVEGKEPGAERFRQTVTSNSDEFGGVELREATVTPTINPVSATQKDVPAVSGIDDTG